VASCSSADAKNEPINLTSDQHSTNEITERAKIMAITKVFERLYIGDANDAEWLSASNPLGITAVVNVNEAPNHSRRDGIKYAHFPLDETRRVPPRTFKQVITTISQLVRTGKVLVHCAAGSSRSPVVVTLFMRVVGYKNFDDALSELRGQRSVVCPLKRVIESAKAYLEEMI
jgi:protein tyrosine phosphatase